jgi:pyrrolidone-carboxylate peptidase
MQAQLLITGFGPFAGVDHNPSGELARLLGQRPDCHGCELPVTFRGAAEGLDRELEALGQPALGILSLGVHRGPGFRLEHRAGGAIVGEREDNEGVTVSSLGLAGPDRETSLDLDALEDALRAAGAMKVRQSRDAGAYVCERTYSHGLQRGAELGIQALFLHVPPGEEQSVGDQLPLVSALVDGLLRQVRS